MRVYSLLPVVAVCTALLPGCFGDTLGIHYNIVIDPNFSAVNQTYIRAAAEGWQNILGDYLDIMSIKVAPCSAGVIPTIGSEPPGNIEIPDPGTMRELCFHPTTGDWISSKTSEPSIVGLTYRHGPEDSADIYMPVDRDSTLSSTAWIETAAHEMGHGMGLEHTQQGTIMYWELDNVPAPTCNDAAQYLGIRHQSTITPECPQGGWYVWEHI